MLSITWRTFCTNSLMISNLNPFSWSWPKAQKYPLDLRFLSVVWSLVSTKVIVAQFQTKVGDCWSMFWRWFVFVCYNDDLLFHPGPDMTTHSVVGKLEGSIHIFPSNMFSLKPPYFICITYNRYLPVISRNPQVFRVVSSFSRCVAFPTKFTYNGNFLKEKIWSLATNCSSLF